MGETAFKTKVHAFLKSLNELDKIWYYKTSDKFTGGIPDTDIVFRGIPIKVELKYGTNKPTPLQKYQMTCINEAGGIAFPLWPKHFEEFKKFMKELSWDNQKKNQIRKKKLSFYKLGLVSINSKKVTT